MNQPHHRSLRSRVPQKMLSAFLIWRGTNFSFKRMRTFFAGLCPQFFGQVVGLKCGLGFAKLFFWGFGFGKTETEFPARRRGLGRNAGGFGNPFSAAAGIL